MIQIIRNKEIASIVDSVNKEWDINASIRDANFSAFLPYTDPPENGIICFPKRLSFNFLLYQIIQKGWKKKNQLFYGNHLVNLNEMIVGALNINDTEPADVLKNNYCKLLEDFLPIVLSFKDYNYNVTNVLLFFLFHELTHVRIAQQPSFFESKKEELSKLVERAQCSIKRRMIKRLSSIKELEEEVICDLVACKIIQNGVTNQTESIETYLDIIRTLNIINSISNIRNIYITTKRNMFITYWQLTQSKHTKLSEARLIFINNFWKDGLLLDNKEVIKEILSSNISLSLSQEAKDFCRSEFEKGESYFNPDNRRAEEIEEEIYKSEESFIESLINEPDSCELNIPEEIDINNNSLFDIVAQK